MADLLINGNDALTSYGVRMGKGFLDAILAFPPMKDYIENKSRTMHGKRMVVKPKYDSRDLTLSFVIIGDGATAAQRQASLLNRKSAFRAVLEAGKLTIKIPSMGDDVYRLVYGGKSTTHSMTTSRTSCVITAKFEEPDPSNRTATDNGGVAVVTN